MATVNEIEKAVSQSMKCLVKELRDDYVPVGLIWDIVAESLCLPENLSTLSEQQIEDLRSAAFTVMKKLFLKEGCTISKLTNDGFQNCDKKGEEAFREIVKFYEAYGCTADPMVEPWLTID